MCISNLPEAMAVIWPKGKLTLPYWFGSSKRIKGINLLSTMQTWSQVQMHLHLNAILEVFAFEHFKLNVFT